MGEKTGIHWTDHTFNIVIGCVKVSPGCTNCYAETLAKNRMGLDVWGPASTTPRRQMSEGYWKNLAKWNRAAKEAGEVRRVFVGSMCDWAEDHPDLIAPRRRFFEMVPEMSNLIFLMLTKRPENQGFMLPKDWGDGYSNVWLGTSVENQEYAEKRIPELLRTPATKRFLSCEPLLGPVRLTFVKYQLPHFPVYLDVLDGSYRLEPDILKPSTSNTLGLSHMGNIDWVIVGGESGQGYRPFDATWAESLRRECDYHKTPFFFKQHGGTKKIDGIAGGDLLNGKRYYQWPA